LKVILKEEIPSLGKVGDIVEVRKGYARNFLIPKKKALEATERNIKTLEMEKILAKLKLDREKARAQKVAEQLRGITCIIEQKVGEDDKLYGSVTSMDVVKKLESQGISIDRKKIHFSQPIKRLGDFTITIKLHPEVTADVTVRVVKA